MQISTYSGRLQLVDATGGIDAMVPDLPSTWNVNSVYEVSFVVGFSCLWLVIVVCAYDDFRFLAVTSVHFGLSGNKIYCGH